MARTGLGPWKIVLAKGSSSHPGWIWHKMTCRDYDDSSSQTRWMSHQSSSHWRSTVSLNAGQKYCRMLQGEHSAILSTFIKLPFVLKIFVLSIFEWPFYTGFTVQQNFGGSNHNVHFIMAVWSLYLTYKLYQDILNLELSFIIWPWVWVSESDIMPCIKMDKPLAVYRFW